MISIALERRRFDATFDGKQFSGKLEPDPARSDQFLFELRAPDGTSLQCAISPFNRDAKAWHGQCFGRPQGPVEFNAGHYWHV